MIRIIFSHGGLSTIGQRHTFRHLRTNHIILIRRNRDCRQNTNNRHHDHQFDQGETLLQLLFHLRAPRSVKTANSAPVNHRC